ncbi:hypothetical protein B7463_g3410, partial [Scytalidium lignicola]
MEKYALYTNPYDNNVLDSQSVIKFHCFDIQDVELKRFVPNLSPFPIKLEAYFRFFSIKYETVFEFNLDNAPRHKVPFISMKGIKISDSDLIINFLKSSLFDPDSDLTPAQKAIGHAVQRMLEDHLYWVNLYYEFFDNDGSDFFFTSARGGLSAVTDTIREDFARRVYNQGTGRYTPKEIVEKASKDLLTLSEVLGDNLFLLGTDKPTSFDAAVFGMTLCFFQARGMHLEVTDFARSIPNLAQYIKRLLETYFPELEAAF